MCPGSRELQLRGAAPKRALRGEEGLAGGLPNFGKRGQPGPRRAPFQIVVISAERKARVPNSGGGGSGDVLRRVTPPKKQEGPLRVVFAGWCPGQPGFGSPKNEPEKRSRRSVRRVSPNRFPGQKRVVGFEGAGARTGRGALLAPGGERDVGGARAGIGWNRFQ